MSDLSSLIDKATSPLLLDIEWDTTLLIVDQIRQGDYTASSAINTLIPRLHHSNPNIVLLALQVLESIVKNCGQTVHEHIASWDFMAEIRDLLKNSTNDEVQKKLLLMLATWVYAFRGEPKYQAVQDTVNILKAEGYKIPSVAESDAMFTADCAPDWADSTCCHRCRSNFTMLRRKHHCRACGQVFCNDCSSKVSIIPKFGIEREVRVCEHCYEEINSAPPANAKTEPPKSTANDVIKDKSPAPDKKSAEELQEEEELQLALALSKSEAENKVKEKLRVTSDLLSGNWRNTQQRSSPPTSHNYSGKFGSPDAVVEKDDTDPELAKYLNRNFWEQRDRRGKEVSNAPPLVTSPVQPSAPSNTVKSNIMPKFYENGGGEEVDEFMSTLRSQLEIFVNRMKSNQSRCRPIANDTAVQSLFVNITAMHGQLLTYIQDQDKKRVHGEQLQDKISQIRDARAALDALREEHRDKLRREKEEQDRLRQIQMMQKLDIMRKKKQEYLEYQRQLALHRMAESERQIMSGQPRGPNIPAVHPNFPQAQQPGYAPLGYQQGYPPNPMGGYMYPPPVENPPSSGPNQPYSVGPNNTYPAAAPVANLPPAQPPVTNFQGHPNPEFSQYPLPAGAAPVMKAPTTSYGQPSGNGVPPPQDPQGMGPQPVLPPNENQAPQQNFQQPEEAALISFD